jgi:chaperonin GroES
MNFQPLFDKLLVKRSEAQDEVTKGGIYMPQSAQQKPNQGTVVAIGPGRVNNEGIWRPISVVPGDKVLFGEFCGVEVSLPEGTFLLLSEEDLLGKFTEPVNPDEVPF